MRGFGLSVLSVFPAGAEAEQDSDDEDGGAAGMLVPAG